MAMKIGDSGIGIDHPPFFIAEAGVNHNGELDLAKDLIDAAADAGADAVKFQTFSAEELVADDAPKAAYQVESTGDGSQYDLLRELELDRAAHVELMEYAETCGITFLSTPFDPPSADLLDDLGVPAIKLGSGELDNHPLLEHVAGLGRPLIISTGMATKDEIEAAREVLVSVDPEINLAFLHCTSSYPCAVSDVNLRAIQSMADRLPDPVGYSDHTTRPELPALAVAAGAHIVEKHFTIDNSLPGPDHAASLEPDELQEAARLVEMAHTALGDPEKRPQPSELDTKKVARKSLRAAADLPVGTTIDESDIWIARPADGLSPRHFDEVIGATVTDAVCGGDPLTEENLDVEID
mgnify:CR=1 FL=1